MHTIFQTTNRDPSILGRFRETVRSGRVWVALALGVGLFPALTASTNLMDFDANGHADFLFHNKTTGELKVWFMNQTNRLYSAPITLSGDPIEAEQGWKTVGTGNFDSSDTNRLGIVWQNESNNVLAIWYLMGTNNTQYDTAAIFTNTPSSGWKARTVGDFDADTLSDLAFENISDGSKAVWLMNGDLTIKTAAVIGYPGVNWRITSSGDFGSEADQTSGTRDGKTDIVLTYYDPASALAGGNLCALWFMDGDEIGAGQVVYDPSESENVVVSDLDARALVTGTFDSDGDQDIGFRNVTVGLAPYWRMSGYYYVSASFMKPEPDPAWKLFSQDWLQSTWRHPDIYPLLSATPGASQVVLDFQIRPYSTYGVTIRRRVAEGSWSTIATNVTASTYTDSFSPSSGTLYEYEVFREGDTADAYPVSGNYPPDNKNYFPARIFTGINLPISSMEDRGKLLVIVDGDVASSISSGLSTYTNDLIGDGWSVVLKADAPRHDDTLTNCASGVARTHPIADILNATNKFMLKSWITNSHSDAKGILLIGHVTAPFSDVVGSPPDAHYEHFGAWTADMWYGDTGSGAIWTDTLTNVFNCNVTNIFPHNHNGVNDGKFDSVYAPSELAMFVGRIDFARLSTFGTDDDVSSEETDLLSQYFAKNHAYRTKATQYENRGVVFGSAAHTDGYLYYYQPGTLNGVAYENAFRNVSSVGGTSYTNLFVGDPLHQKTDSYLWGFVSSKTGLPDRIGSGLPGGSTDDDIAYLHQHTAADLVESEAKVAFYGMLASFIPDWYITNDFMRATLATPNYGLAAVWMAPELGAATDSATHWQFQSLAIGNVLGDGMTRTVNTGRASTGDSLALLTILGDPTLRTQIIAPVEIDSGSQIGDSVTLSWTPGESGCEFYAYEAAARGGPYARVTTSITWPTSSTNVTFTADGSSTAYMIRAVKSVTTGSATFDNLSQGDIWEP